MITPFYYPSTGGVESIVRDTSEELAKRGHDVSIVTTTLNNMWERVGESGEEKGDNVTIHRLKSSSFKVGRVPIMKDLRRTLSQLNPDIVHSHNLHPHLFQAAEWKDHIGYSLVAQLHAPEIAGMDHLSCRILFPLVSLFLSKKQRMVDTFLVHTDIEMYSLIARGIERRRIKKVRYPCISSAVFCRARKAESKTNMCLENMLLYIGRLSRRKGIEVLLRSLPYVIHDIKDTLALIIGPSDKDYRRRLIHLAGRLKLRDYVTFGEPLPEEKKFEVMKSCTIFVAPSIRDYTPVALVEAQALGVAVVSTKVGGIGEIVKNGHTGILVRPGNPCDLAQAIMRLLQNGNERRRMGSNAHVWVGDNFLVENTVSEIERVYRNCVD